MRKVIIVSAIIVFISIALIFVYRSQNSDLKPVSRLDLTFLEETNHEYGVKIENTKSFNKTFNDKVPVIDLVTSDTAASVKELIHPYPAVFLQRFNNHPEEFDKMFAAGTIKVKKKFWDRYVSDTGLKFSNFPFGKTNISKCLVRLLSLRDVPSNLINSGILPQERIDASVDGRDYFVELTYYLIGATTTITYQSFAAIYDGVIYPYASDTSSFVSGDKDNFIVYHGVDGEELFDPML